ncbi:MAG: hypothetical protein ACKV2U_15125 [Bryobacteraceae bacterium]
MSLNNFEYGFGAIVAPDRRDSFDSCTQNLIADTRPANFLEQLVVDQLLHAQWDLNRVNQLTGNLEAEEELLNASARATRNWTRASRELAAMQTARASHLLCRAQTEAPPPPFADLTKVPKRRGPTTAVAEAHCDNIIANSLIDLKEKAA